MIISHLAERNYAVLDLSIDPQMGIAAPASRDLVRLLSPWMDHGPLPGDAQIRQGKSGDGFVAELIALRGSGFQVGRIGYGRKTVVAPTNAVGPASGARLGDVGIDELVGSRVGIALGLAPFPENAAQAG